jgi:hypothetical protein
LTYVRNLPALFIEEEGLANQIYALVRHTENQDNRDEFGNLHSGSVAFQTDHLHDYSTNLLGVFQCKDLKWKWLKGTSCIELWNLKDEAIMPVLEQDVTIVEGRGTFYLKINELHKQLFDLPAPIGDTEKLECLVLHTPTKSNFWHFSLRWIVKGEDTTNWEPKRRRKVLETARSVIISNAIFEQPTFQIMPESYYIQQS